MHVLHWPCLFFNLAEWCSKNPWQRRCTGKLTWWQYPKNSSCTHRSWYIHWRNKLKLYLILNHSNICSVPQASAEKRGGKNCTMQFIFETKKFQCTTSNTINSNNYDQTSSTLFLQSKRDHPKVLQHPRFQAFSESVPSEQSVVCVCFFNNHFIRLQNSKRAGKEKKRTSAAAEFQIRWNKKLYDSTTALRGCVKWLFFVPRRMHEHQRGSIHTKERHVEISFITQVSSLAWCLHFSF